MQSQIKAIDCIWKTLQLRGIFGSISCNWKINFNAPTFDQFSVLYHKRSPDKVVTLKANAWFRCHLNCPNTEYDLVLYDKPPPSFLSINSQFTFYNFLISFVERCQCLFLQHQCFYCLLLSALNPSCFFLFFFKSYNCRRLASKRPQCIAIIAIEHLCCVSALFLFLSQTSKLPLAWTFDAVPLIVVYHSV